tara:strand:+ start:1670 stop:2434 length:765 start_codon:yes stop_codon:yes gene_type:complete
MPLENDNIVPEDVAGEIELLVQGRGQFVDAEEAGLRREEDVEEADFDDPQAEDDADAVQASVLSRLAEIEQALIAGLPSVDRPEALPDQNVEFGDTVGVFSSGTTITLDPKDVDGTDTGEDNLTVYLQADRSSVTAAIADGTLVSWERFETREAGGVAGVLVGGVVSADDTDQLVASQSGQTAGFLSAVLIIDPAQADNLTLTLNGATYELNHDIPNNECFCMVGTVDTIKLDKNGHVGWWECCATCCGPGFSS